MRLFRINSVFAIRIIEEYNKNVNKKTDNSGLIKRVIVYENNYK